MTEMTWTKANDTQTLTTNGKAVAYITPNALGGWTARRTSGALIARVDSPYQAKRAAIVASVKH